MGLFEATLGIIITVESILTAYYAHKILEGIYRNPEVTLRLFFLKERVSTSFKFLSIFIVLYGIVGSVVGIIQIFSTGMLSPYVLEIVATSSVSISLAGVIYFLREVSIATRSTGSEQ